MAAVEPVGNIRAGWLDGVTWDRDSGQFSDYYGESSEEENNNKMETGGENIKSEVEAETESCMDNIEENLAHEIEEESEELKEMEIIEKENMSRGR